MKMLSVLVLYECISVSPDKLRLCLKAARLSRMSVVSQTGIESGSGLRVCRHDGRGSNKNELVSKPPVGRLIEGHAVLYDSRRTFFWTLPIVLRGN